MKKPNPQWWKVFITEWLKNGNNATQAYLRARPKVKSTTAAANGEKLLRNTEFKKFMKSHVDSLSEKLEDEAVTWVRRIKESCVKDLDRIDDSYEQMAPAADPGAIRHLTAAKKTADDIMRRSLGLPDAPAKLEISADDDLRKTIQLARKAVFGTDKLD